MSEVPPGFLALALIALVAASAFITCAGTSLLALSRPRIKRLHASGQRRARRVRRLLKRTDRLIGTIFIANQLVNMTAAAIATLLGYRTAGLFGVAGALLLLALLLLVFGELLPKHLAARDPDRIALATSAPTQLLVRLLRPVVWLVHALFDRLLRLAPAGRTPPPLAITEFRALIAETGQLIPASHQALLLQVIELDQLTVEDVMVPRAEIAGLNLDHSDAQLHEVLSRCEFTRIPVWQGELDQICGVLHMRDAGQLLGPTQTLHRDRLVQVIRPPYFVPEGTPLPVQLFNFQKQKQRVALVVDEYGSVLGLLTCEDILQQTVSALASREFHSDGIVAQEDGTWLVDGAANLRELNRKLEWTIEVDGPKTVSGLLLEHLQSFPDAPVGIQIDRYAFEIWDWEGRKVKRARAFERAVPADG